METKKIIKGTLKVLCLEDSPQDAELIRELLIDTGYDLSVDVTSTEKEFVSLLKSRKYDIILSDFKLPGFNAFGALQISVLTKPDIPFICVSGSIGEETAIELLKKGAVDYVLKDRMGKLAFAVQRALDEVKEKESLQQAEKALIDSEKRYHKLAEISPVGIFRTDETGVTTYVNPRWCEISGLSADKAFGYGWLNAVHPDDREKLSNGWKDTINQEIASYAEYRFLRPDGSIIWVMGQAVPELDANNQIVGYVGTTTDITERKNAEIEKERIEKELRINGERLNYAMEATSDALWDINLLTGDSYLSQRYFTILDYKPGEVIGNLQSFQQRIHPDDVDHYIQIFDEYYKNLRDSHSIEFRVRSKKHEWKWILSRGKIVERDTEGKSLRLVGTHVDITEQKKIEEDLKRKNRALRILSECNGALVKINDEKELTNEICQKIYSIGGYLLVWLGLVMHDETQSVIPIAWAGNESDDVKFMNITWGDNELGSSPAGKAIKSGVFSLIRNVKSDQDFIPWLGEALKKGYNSVLSLPLVIDKKAIGALTICSIELNGFDTEEIKLLTELASDLSYGIMSIRTKEGHDRLSAQLFQSQKSEAIGRLAGGIAHDFNNILTVILGNAEMMPYELNNLELTIKHIEQIKKSAEKAAALTHQLLAFSRKEIIEPKRIDLNKQVLEMQKMLKRIISEDIDLDVSLEPNLFQIEADQSHIDQIIMNLVINAKDAMPDGGDLSIKTENLYITEQNLSLFPKAKFDKYIILEVKDTGSGISEDIISKIFDPFFTTKTSGKGTGLGLSVVDGIVNQNQGWIDVSSEVGKGTSFKIYFPALDEEQESVTKDEQDLFSSKGAGERILVLEDEQGILELASTTLTANGYRVFEAINLKTALNILEKEKGNFDLVFSDIILPDGSGIDFYEKAIENYPNLKVLFTSGYADEKGKWDNIQKKNYKFIQKPYKIFELLVEIKRICNGE
jgi:PAS domain S-box-containing protein